MYNVNEDTDSEISNYISQAKDDTDIPDSHLQSPIKIDNRWLFTQPLEKVPFFLGPILKDSPIDRNWVDKDSEKVYGLLFQDIQTCFLTKKIYKDNRIDIIYNEISTFLKTHTHKLPAGILSSIPSSLGASICSLFELKEEWEYIRKTMQHFKNNKDKTWKSYSPRHISIKTIHICQAYTIFSDQDSHHWLLDYDQVLMITDTIIARVFTLTYNKILPLDFPSRIDPLWLLNLYNIYDRLIINKGNNAYAEVKSYESLIQGILLEHHDALYHSNVYIQTIKKDLADSGHTTALDVYDFVKESNLSVHKLAELHGIFRHWGHPTVNEVEGCEKVKKIAHSRTLPSHSRVQELSAMFSRQFCISFISRFGRWPRINLINLSRMSRLRSVIEGNRTTVNFYAHDFTLSDWAKLQFEKELNFDFHLDFTTICDDKAISVYLQDLPCLYAKEALGYDPGRPRSSRRVLLELLQRGELDIKGIFDKISKREVPESWKIILLSPKEREMKLEPRLFAMMVLEMRIYFCITESNISSQIFPFFPQQTMTLSEGELTKRLYSLSNPLNAPQHLPCYLSIDFKSWNIHWQYTSTQPIFSQLDQIFGLVGVYTYTHVFFEESLCILSSRYKPPPQLCGKRPRHITVAGMTSEFSWTNHLGGFEGQRQKGWTLATICLLLLVELKTGVKAYIIGQGDNQVCKLMLPRSNFQESPGLYISTHQDEISNTIKEYIEILSEFAGDIGLVIKQEESWVSSTFINYGKEILYRGAYLSQVCKRISRVLPDVNEVYPTLETTIATLQTTGLSSAQKSVDIWASYILCQIETALTLIGNMEHSVLMKSGYSKEIKEWSKRLSTVRYLLHCNAEIDALPIQSPYNYLYRGHPDPLTTYTTFIYDNVGHCDTCKGRYHQLLLGNYQKGRGDASLLVSNPLAINIERPMQLSNQFLKHMQSTLCLVTKNKSLREVFHINSVAEDTLLYNYLISCRPVYPRTIHELMRLTPTGTRMGIISTFSNTRTLKQISQPLINRDFVRKVIESGRQIINHMVDMEKRIYQSLREEVPLKCPTVLAQKLRDTTWSILLKGEPVLGVTVPYPLHQFIVNSHAHSNHSTCHGSMEFILLQSAAESREESLYSRGSYTPYVGSTTKEKHTGKIFQISEISRPLMAAQRLINIADWCVAGDSNLKNFVLSIADMKTNINLQLLKQMSGSITSGSIHHRLNDHITKRSTLNNMRANIASHIYLSSDEMGKFSRGFDNYNMHFQGAMHIGILCHHLLALSTNWVKRPTIHIHYSCKDCEEPIPDHKIENDLPLPRVTNLYKNPLFHSTLESIPMDITPTSPIFTFGALATPAEAAASLLFSGSLKSFNNQIWATTESTAVLGSALRIGDIAKIGIRPILDKLSLLVYLYFLDISEDPQESIAFIGDHMFKEISSCCLLPELIHELIDAAGGCLQNELYTSTKACTRLLSRALLRKINNLKKYGLQESDKNSWFFKVPGCSIPRLFDMWSKLVRLAHPTKQLDFLPFFHEMAKEVSMDHPLPSSTVLNKVWDYIQATKDHKLILEVVSNLQFRVSSLPAEEVVYHSNIISQGPKNLRGSSLPATLKPFVSRTTRLVYSTEFSCPSRTLLSLDIQYIQDEHTKTELTYQDHVFKIVGDLSSAFLKYYQLIAENYINLDNGCICLADGEGTIADMLLRAGSPRIWFNTKIITTNLIPHRGTSYIPAALALKRDFVYGANLSSLLGGDLVDDRYVQEFIRILPNKASLVTMDAEGLHRSGKATLVKIVHSTLRICVQSQASHLIFKHYIDQVEMTGIVVGMLNKVYDHISLQVPIFSSNENYEVFLVCKGFNPMDRWEDIHQATQLKNAYSDVLADSKRQRITSTPFQTYSPYWRDIIQWSLKAGYTRNLSHQLELLVGFRYIHEGEDILMWVRSIISSIEQSIGKVVKGYFQSRAGSRVNIENRVVLLANKAVHITLDEWCTYLINLKTLEKILRLPVTDALNVILKIGEEEILILPDDKVLYSFSIPYKEYQGQYIKAIWKVYGNHLYQNL